jgi:TPR repeat protein
MGGEELFLEADRQSNLGNHKKAFALLLEAEAQGFLPAQNSIGYCLDRGLGIKKDRRAAFAWYKRAARNGDLCAIGNVGLHYREDGNEERARFWLRRAVEAGDGDSAFELARLYAKRRDIGQNRFKTVHYLWLAVRSRSITPSAKEAAQAMVAKFASAERPGRRRIARRK